MRHRLGVCAALFVLLIGVAGCGAPAPTSPLIPPTEALPTAATSSSPLLDVIPTVEVLATPAQSTPAAMSAPPDLLAGPDIDPNELSARGIAAAALGVTAADVTVVEIAPMNWNDSSLGCPQPDYLYAQVITPGYKATVEISDKTYFVHMDASGQGVLCLDAH